MVSLPSSFPMNASGSSLSLPVKDPSGNQIWEGFSCLGEASQECEGFTIATSLSPCSVALKAMCSGKLQTALLVAGYFVYLLVGAAVFQALERTAEKQEKMAAAQMKEAFLQNFTQLTVPEMEQFMKVSGALLKSFLPPASPSDVVSYSSLPPDNSHCFPSDLDASSKPLSSVSRQLTLMASTALRSWTKPCVC